MTDIARPLLDCPQGWTLFYEYTEAGKAPWFTVRDYCERDGGGAFVVFQTQDTAGKWIPAWTINPGLVDATPGKFSSDIDFVGYTEGRMFNISFSGAWSNQGIRVPPAIGTWPSEFMALGTAYNRWLELWMKEYPPRPGMPRGTKSCVKINGRYCPLFD